MALYGIPAAVVPELKSIFDRVEEADYIAPIPQPAASPLEAGCTLVKDANTLVQAFSTRPAFLQFDNAELQAQNYYEYGFQKSWGFER